ncbi:MAG: condensation domain-containing protein [Gordonia sp. (in: high G+C Gram-positive bacteria)]|uniref:condensation domain-containing protein n=1 Tax=Gordonia sp. (in: high G+C Gram-positive bacteria) TaxID=84139 RepID=UPI0039E5DFF1
MEFVQILDAPIRPGGLVEWTPSTPGGFGDWHRDPRATSHNHEHHLRSAHEYRERTNQAGGREAWLGVSVEFDEPFSVPAVRAMLTAYINRHEVLRTHVALSGSTTTRYTADPGTVRVTMRRIGWYTETDLLTEQIAGSLDRATAPLLWPAYRFATVSRPGGFTLLFAADHSLVDGYSLANAPHEFRELYQAARDRTAGRLPRTGSYIDFSGTERVAADEAGDDHPAVAVWRGFLDGDTALPRFEALPERDRPETRIPQRSHNDLLLDADRTAAFERACAGHGGATVVGGLLAAAAIVYRAQTGADRFATLMPRHTRTSERFQTALGWFVGLAPVAVDVADDPGFPVALDRAMDSLDSARAGASLPLLRLAEILGFDPAPRFVVSYMDLRRVPGNAASAAAGDLALRSHAYSDDEVYVWVNRTDVGLLLHTRFPADDADGAALAAFLTDFADLLASIAAGE